MSRSSIRDLVILLALVVTVYVGLGALSMCGARTRAPLEPVLRHTQCRAIAHCFHMYSLQHTGVYPQDFGSLVAVDDFQPKLLIAGPPSAVKDLRAQLDSFSPRDAAAVQAFAAQHASYEVLVWGESSTGSDADVMLYERLHRSDWYALVAFQDNSVRRMPQEDAVELIRAAGHEPVWADEP